MCFIFRGFSPAPTPVFLYMEIFLLHQQQLNTDSFPVICKFYVEQIQKKHWEGVNLRQPYKRKVGGRGGM